MQLIFNVFFTGFQFNPVAPLTEKDPDYNQTPSADDKIHVLVCLLSANASEIKESVLDKMNKVRDQANDLGKNASGSSQRAATLICPLTKLHRTKTFY